MRFLKAGDKVKVTIMFRGREQSRPELGFRLLRRLEEEISELGYVEAAPKQDGRNMIMVIAPHRATKPARGGQRPRDGAEAPPGDEATGVEAGSNGAGPGLAGNASNGGEPATGGQ